ncbi:MAG TPA: alpha/beta hydrolase [Mycobacteriales bacterium]|nr:alpha/beta hydrolase [Mycobacteriales bacterium]
MVTRRRLLAGGAGAALAAAAAALLGRRGPDLPDGVERDVERYGAEPEQVVEWWLPARPAGPLRTVVLVHGGFWRPGFDRSLEHDVAAALVERGLLVANVDYRPSSVPWPATLADVAAAHDLLSTGTHAGRVAPDGVAVAGHSAGGHLALWLASRHRLPPGAVGARPLGPRPALVVAQAPVAALRTAARERLGGGAVQALLGGGPGEVPDRYRVADPVGLLPTGVRTVCVHGDADDVVPPAQSREYVRAATRAGDDARLELVPGGHFEHLEPMTAAGAALVAALDLR